MWQLHTSDEEGKITIKRVFIFFVSLYLCIYFVASVCRCPKQRLRGVYPEGPGDLHCQQNYSTSGDYCSWADPDSPRFVLQIFS